jgi:hypothetical protein
MKSFLICLTVSMTFGTAVHAGHGHNHNNQHQNRGRGNQHVQQFNKQHQNKQHQHGPKNQEMTIPLDPPGVPVTSNQTVVSKPVGRDHRGSTGSPQGGVVLSTGKGKGPVTTVNPTFADSSEHPNITFPKQSTEAPDPVTNVDETGIGTVVDAVLDVLEGTNIESNPDDSGLVGGPTIRDHRN